MVLDYNHLELAKYLHRTGHFWRPDNTDCHNIESDDLPKLGKNNRLLKSAIASHQAFEATYGDLSWAYHGRNIIPDGDVGPVTLDVVKMERCPVPDWDMPDGAAMPVFDDNPSIQADLEGIARSMNQWSDEIQVIKFDSWPLPGCNPNRPNQEREHSTRVHIDTSRATTSQKASMVEECALVAVSEAEVGQHVEFIFDSGMNPSNIAEHDVRYEDMRGPIGYAFFPTPGTCNQTMKCRLAIRYDRSILENAALKQHEFKGHSDGLRHTNGGRMNAILRKPTGGRLTWIGDPHEKTKLNYFKDGILVNTDSIVPVIKMIDGEFSVAVWGYLTRLKVEVISSTPIDTSTIKIRNKGMGVERTSYPSGILEDLLESEFRSIAW